ncbi:DoxX family protein [Nocardia salmonicida]|uniref:DoxX family protein n=1 Tax=Nocardia salmonicida TaxID=53431 RepID=UPI0033E7E414
MDVVLLVGRILFAFLFAGSAIGHLTKADDMAGYAAAKGVPMAKASVLASGVMLVLGALSVVLGLWGDVGSILLFVFLVPTAVLMHAFWKETDPMAKQMEMIHFNKDVALAGAALAFLWIFSTDPDLTLTDSLLGLG